jgi:hypothetical protein
MEAAITANARVIGILTNRTNKFTPTPYLQNKKFAARE